MRTASSTTCWSSIVGAISFMRIVTEVRLQGQRPTPEEYDQEQGDAAGGDPLVAPAAPASPAVQLVRDAAPTAAAGRRAARTDTRPTLSSQVTATYCEMGHPAPRRARPLLCCVTRCRSLSAAASRCLPCSCDQLGALSTMARHLSHMLAINMRVCSTATGRTNHGVARETEAHRLPLRLCSASAAAA